MPYFFPVLIFFYSNIQSNAKILKFRRVIYKSLQFREGEYSGGHRCKAAAHTEPASETQNLWQGLRGPKATDFSCLLFYWISVLFLPMSLTKGIHISAIHQKKPMNLRFIDFCTVYQTSSIFILFCRVLKAAFYCYYWSSC